MASPRNASLRQQITAALSDAGPSGLTAGDIARKVEGGAKKKEINVEIYQRMMPEGLVEKAHTGNPPLWRLRQCASSSSNTPLPDATEVVPDPPRSVPDPPSSVQDPPTSVPDPPTSVPDPPRSVPDPPNISPRPPRSVPDHPVLQSKASPDPPVNSVHPVIDPRPLPVNPQPAYSLIGSSKTLNALDVKELKKESGTSHEKRSETETLEARILQVLRRSPEPLSALSIAKSVGKENTGQVNPTLYGLKETFRVQRKQLSGESKPLWCVNPNLQQPDCVSAGGDATPLATVTPKRETAKLYSHEVDSDGRITFTPHDGNNSSNSPSQDSDQSEPPSARKPKQGKPRVGLAAVFPSTPDAQGSEEEQDKHRILELLGQRPAASEQTREISEKLGHPTRARAMKALRSLKEEGKVSEDIIDSISFWCLKL